MNSPVLQYKTLTLNLETEVIAALLDCVAAQFEGHPLESAILERLGEDGHGLLKVFCSGLPLAQGRKGGAERCFASYAAVYGHPLAGVRLERLNVGGHSLIIGALSRSSRLPRIGRA